MKAIVLTYDRNQPFADLMIRRYRHFWPNHPFQFKVPFQELNGLNHNKRVTFKKTSPNICNTVLELLEGMDDEEWVYWAIDDKYVADIDTSHMELLLTFLDSPESDGIDGVCPMRIRSLRANSILQTPINFQVGTFYRRIDWEQIWLHQFLRVKVLRFFFTEMLSVLCDQPAKEMDRLKKDIEMDYNLLVTEQSWISLWESTSRGMGLKSTRIHCLMHGIKVDSSVQFIDKSIRMGTYFNPSLKNRLDRGLLRFLRIFFFLWE